MRAILFYDHPIPVFHLNQYECIFPETCMVLGGKGKCAANTAEIFGFFQLVPDGGRCLCALLNSISQQHNRVPGMPTKMIALGLVMILIIFHKRHKGFFLRVGFWQQVTYQYFSGWEADTLCGVSGQLDELFRLNAMTHIERNPDAQLLGVFSNNRRTGIGPPTNNRIRFYTADFGQL